MRTLSARKKAGKRGRKKRTSPVSDSAGVEQVRLEYLIPAFVNNEIYKPVSPSDPGIRELAESIKKLGLLEPIVATDDYYIVSGHRRHAACRLAGLMHVPVRRLAISIADPNFAEFLVTFNKQRVKTVEEQVREA